MKIGLFLFLKKKTATTPIDAIDFAQKKLFLAPY
jgi:hypothetical protein